MSPKDKSVIVLSSERIKFQFLRFIQSSVCLHSVKMKASLRLAFEMSQGESFQLEAVKLASEKVRSSHIHRPLMRRARNAPRPHPGDVLVQQLGDTVGCLTPNTGPWRLFHARILPKTLFDLSADDRAISLKSLVVHLCIADNVLDVLMPQVMLN